MLKELETKLDGKQWQISSDNDRYDRLSKKNKKS